MKLFSYNKLLCWCIMTLKHTMLLFMLVSTKWHGSYILPLTVSELPCCPQLPIYQNVEGDSPKPETVSNGQH